METCTSCTYFDEIEDCVFICRRYPPKTDSQGKKTYQEVCPITDWCGEFKRDLDQESSSEEEQDLIEI